MSHHKALFLIAVVTSLNACASRTPGTNPFRANVGETLNVTLASAIVPQAIRALQSTPTLDDAKVELQIQPTYAQRRTSAIETIAYTAALDDAAAKAEAIAARERVTLGSVRSVTEMTPEQGGPGYIAGGRGIPMKGITVAGPANGVVTLAVTDGGRVPIAVFGVHAGPPQEYKLRDATGLWVSIRARDESLGAAQHRMTSVEEAVRTIVTRFGATPKDIVVTSADANTF